MVLLVHKSTTDLSDPDYSPQKALISWRQLPDNNPDLAHTESVAQGELSKCWGKGQNIPLTCDTKTVARTRELKELRVCIFISMKDETINI